MNSIESTSFVNPEKAHHPHGWLDNNGANDWDLWTTYIQDKQNTVWEASLRIANSATGEKILLYDIKPIKMVERAGTAATTSTANNVTQTTPQSQSASQNNSGTHSEHDPLMEEITRLEQQIKKLEKIKMDRVRDIARLQI